MDLSEATRQDLPLDLAGATYWLRPRTLQELGPLQAWFKRESPGPLAKTLAALDQCERQGVAVARGLRELVLEAAHRHERRWPPPLGSRDWLAAVEDAAKVGFLVHFALSPRHPDLTESQAERLAETASPDELAVLCCALFTGRLPDPKARATSTSTTTTTSEETPPATTGAP